MWERIVFCTLDGSATTEEKFLADHKSEWDKLSANHKNRCLANFEAQAHQILQAFIRYGKELTEFCYSLLNEDDHKYYLVILPKPKVKIYILLPHLNPEIRVYDLIVT